MYSIERYNKSHEAQWNSFVKASKNGTFLFDRNFMDYHADRFTDHSLLVFEGSKLRALLPAHITDGNVYSHWGLTYGGLVLGFKIHLADAIHIVKHILEYLNAQGIQKLFIKSIPAIYHKTPSQELEYVMFLANAKLIRRDSLSVVEYSSAPGFSKTRKEAVRRGLGNGLEILEDNDLALFWNKILIPNLYRKHNATPVHTLEEMQLLKQHFPESIRHFNVFHNGEIVAGTTIFLTDTVAHPQYISGTENNNALGSLDYLYAYIIDLFKDKKYFDFGPSTEEQSRKLKGGILFWKESYGASTLTQDFYEADTSNYVLLHSITV